MTAVEFNSVYVTDTMTGPKRWRRSLRFDPTRASAFLQARGGGHKEVSIGRWLLQQGAAWGEAVVGRPIRVRPKGWTYSRRYLEEAAAAAEASLPGSSISIKTSESELAAAAAEGALPGEEDKDPPSGEKEAREEAEDDEEKKEEKGDERKQPEKGREEAATPRTSDKGGGGTADVDDADDMDADVDADVEDDDDASLEWWSANVLEYNDQTGEHQLLYADGVREWLPLVMQETHPEGGVATTTG